MEKAYSYSWYIEQFIAAKKEAEQFIYSLNDSSFFQRPGKNIWCIAECYSHQINFGEIYFRTIQKGLNNNHESIDAADSEQEFKPRWFWKLAESFFEPPYKMKVKTLEPFEPDNVSGLSRENILSEFTDLQDRFIDQLKGAQQENINLNRIRSTESDFFIFENDFVGVLCFGRSSSAKTSMAGATDIENAE